MKKQNVIKMVLFAAVGSLLVSCSVEKRHYNKGYHVQWGAGKANTQANATPNKPAESVAVATAKPSVEVASVENVISSLPVTSPAKTATAPKVAKAKTNTNATAAKAPVATAAPTATKAMTKLLEKSYQVTKLKKPAPTSPFKKMIDITALILCLFLGFIGAHRFYLKYTTSAIVMLLLFVLSFGPFLLVSFLGFFVFVGWLFSLALTIWVVYDLIMIITEGDFFFAK